MNVRKSSRRFRKAAATAMVLAVGGGVTACDAAANQAAPSHATANQAAPSQAAGRPQTCTTDAEKGSCGPYGYQRITGTTDDGPTVGQDVWNPIPGWQQTLHATDPGSWYVTARMPTGNTAVVS